MPCHYSTFDVADGGTVLFGPAGRPLPQLPLRVLADGALEAAGPMSRARGPGVVGGAAGVIDRPLEAVDRRTRIARPLRAVLRYIFPDNWSFLWGEIALYCFVVLVITGVYLTLFFDPSYALMRYHGSYRPLAGASMSHAYASTLRLSLNVKAGLLIRQTHHWAALVFVAAIIMHLCRVFFTGAFRRPRELIWISGVTLLTLAMLEGFIGYSLPDDLLSGMGLAIAYSVAMSIPIIGAPLAFLIWNGPFPAAPSSNRGCTSSTCFLSHSPWAG